MPARKESLAFRTDTRIGAHAFLKRAAVRYLKRIIEELQEQPGRLTHKRLAKRAHLDRHQLKRWLEVLEIDLNDYKCNVCCISIRTNSYLISISREIYHS